VDANLKRKFYSEHGGDKPGKLLDDAARKIAKGEVGVAVVCGGEALASCKYDIISTSNVSTISSSILPNYPWSLKY